MPNSKPKKVITVLLSEREAWFIDLISETVHQAAKSQVRVIAYTPKTNHEDDVFQTASRHNWDFTVLFLNNIHYASGNRDANAIAHESIDFVMKMAVVFEKPIFALHGLNEESGYEARLRQAGAVAVYGIPFPVDAMVPALRKYSRITMG